jgi:S1-C subfamily serine protease
VPRLRDYGDIQWSWTGLRLQALRDFNKNIYFPGTEGVIVASTDPESPARLAGIQDRDRIVSIDGRPANALTEDELPDLRRRIALLPTDEAVTVEILRGEEPVSLELTPKNKGRVEGEELDCPRWDLTLKGINQFDNPDLYFYRKQGVFVYGVKFPGNAATAGLRAQDIILKVDGKDITALDDVKTLHQSALEAVANRPRILFTVLRNGLMRQVILDFSREYK